MSETHAERVERLRPERESQPDDCSHCQFTTSDLENYSREYGANVGGHWLCIFCRATMSASRLGAGLQPYPEVQDMAAMLNVLRNELTGDLR